MDVPIREFEPGEIAAEAGLREAKQETGLDIVAGGVLGRRTHPQTGRQKIYLAARPARHADAQSVFIGDQIELDEVRWLARAEVEELMPGALEPVLAYLDGDHRRHTT